MRYGFCGSEGEPYALLGDEAVPQHPMNEILDTMLRWFEARYTKLRKRTALSVLSRASLGTKHLAGTWTVQGEQDKRQTESDLDSYDALLSLLDEQLKLQWPANDKIGDQLPTTQSAQSDATNVDSPDGSTDCDSMPVPVEEETDDRPAKRRKRGD